MDWIKVLPGCKVAVCKRCRLGLLLDKTFDRRLQDLHRLAPSVRQLARQKLIEKEPAVIEDEIELVERFKYPAKEPPLDPPDIHKGGLACDFADNDGRKCTNVCRSLTVKVHCKTVRGWANVQDRVSHGNLSVVRRR